jgi:hypothetical protein
MVILVWYLDAIRDNIAEPIPARVPLTKKGNNDAA